MSKKTPVSGGSPRVSEPSAELGNEEAGENFGKVFANYAHDARAVSYIAPILDEVASKLADEADEEIKNLFAKINIDGKKDNESDDEKDFVKNIVEFKTDMESLQKVDFFHQVQKFTPILGATKVIGKSLVLALVGQFDTFEADLLRTIFNVCPSKIDGSKKPLTLAELKTFESIEDARRYLIEDEIDMVLRGSHKSHVDAIGRVGNFTIDRKGRNCSTRGENGPAG